MKLRDYQLEAVAHLMTHDSAGLFLDMGLGKTASTLSALEDGNLPALAVAPKRVAEAVWPVETRTWRPDLSVAAALGRPEQRRAALMSSADLVALGRDNLGDVERLNTERRRAGLEPFRTLILDELSGFKNGGRRGSQRWKLAKRFTQDRDVSYIYGLTGTPSPNGLMDLWAQIHLLDDGARLGRTITSFRQAYFVEGRRLPSGIVCDWILRPGAEEAIHNAISDICLSMGTEGRVDLPPMTINPVRVGLPPRVRRVYDKLVKDMVADLDALGGGEGVFSAATAASLSNRLSQVSAGFLYPDVEDQPGAAEWLHTEKLSALREICDGTGSPVLVFYRYREERDAILRELKDLRPETLEGLDSVERWNAGEIPLMVTHPASAGHGLNLQHGGHTIVWTSLTWSLEEWQQANKRLARSGQTHPVVVHVLETADSVDQAILLRLEKKATVQDALLAYLERGR